MNIFQPKYRNIKVMLRAFGEQYISVKSEARYTAAFWEEKLNKLKDRKTWGYVITAYLAYWCTDEERKFIDGVFFGDCSVVKICNELYISRSVYYKLYDRVLTDIIGLALEADLINILQDAETASVVDDCIDYDTWVKIEDLVTKATKRKTTDVRKNVSAMLYVETNNVSWRELPKNYGNWNAVYKRYVRWCNIGLWDRVLEIIRSE